MNARGVIKFIRSSHKPFTKKTIFSCWAVPILGVLLDFVLFWHGIPSPEGDTSINYGAFQTHFLYILFFILVAWGIKLLIYFNKTTPLIITRELYGGSSFLLAAIAFLTVGIKTLLMFGTAQDVAYGLVLVAISALGSIMLGIVVVNGRIHSLSNNHMKKKGKTLLAVLATTLIAISGVF